MEDEVPWVSIQAAVVTFSDSTSKEEKTKEET